MQVMKGVLSFDLEHSVTSLLGIERQVYHFGKYTAISFVIIMGFNTVKFQKFTVIVYLVSKIKVNR